MRASTPLGVSPSRDWREDFKVAMLLSRLSRELSKVTSPFFTWVRVRREICPRLYRSSISAAVRLVLSRVSTRDSRCNSVERMVM